MHRWRPRRSGSVRAHRLIALGAVAFAGASIALACSGSTAANPAPEAGVVEAGDASLPDTSPADAGLESSRSADAGVCKLVGSTCEGAGSGWHCCGVEKGFPFDFDAGCVRRTSVPLGCRSEPLEEGNACAYNAAIGCLMRTRDGGVEAFWTPTDYGGFISADDDVSACTEEIDTAVKGADRCPP